MQSGVNGISLLSCCRTVIMSPHNGSEKMSPMRGELIALNKKELVRASVMQQVVDGLLSIREAAPILGLSVRQVKRLKKVLDQGFASLAYGNRGEDRPMLFLQVWSPG